MKLSKQVKLVVIEAMNLQPKMGFVISFSMLRFDESHVFNLFCHSKSANDNSILKTGSVTVADLKSAISEIKLFMELN